MLITTYIKKKKKNNINLINKLKKNPPKFPKFSKKSPNYPVTHFIPLYVIKGNRGYLVMFWTQFWP